MRPISRRELLKLSVLLSLGSVLTKALSSTSPTEVQDIESYINKYAQQYHIPGMSICFMM